MTYQNSKLTVSIKRCTAEANQNKTKQQGTLRGRGINEKRDKRTQNASARVDNGGVVSSIVAGCGCGGMEIMIGKQVDAKKCQRT